MTTGVKQNCLNSYNSCKLTNCDWSLFYEETTFCQLRQGTQHIFNYILKRLAMTKHSKSTKANSLQAMTQDLLENQIHKICRYDEMCKMLIINLIKSRQHKFKLISTSAYPQEEKDIMLEAKAEYTGKLISQTAHHITDLHVKM